MSEHLIIKNEIITSTNTSGVNLYKMSKLIIDEYSKNIDINIQIIAHGELLKSKIATIDIACKDEFVEFQTKQIAFYELYCFILNFNIDFSISSRELYLASSKSERIFYIKSIYIELYRYLERHNKDLGDIRKLNGASEKYKEYNKCLLDFRTNYYVRIKTGRNIFFAHLDKKTQYKEYYKFVDNLDAEEVAKMCINFLAIQEKLSVILEKISNSLTNDAVVFNDLIQKKKEETEIAGKRKLKE